ncbi:motility protein A [Pseudobacteriovorax antillogorgiicola]|uniref:Chemotaxis protein MotA n=1 Tax=Pseudobacteriovorax antillogorgiicola TaxID=1513793 RepID=A0A1Y6C7X0_9BACT|nr:MotA/TolQ/ExbB proton channel family protein [Pseudobacteriovorax antillogorgiicola]TCS49418.1 chemotaxis protein MotA [Pseudobacteriovorax antillogorgiicola]SMF46892.1 chemotaxis protein MotA [Pseudobacteriovorax antillogorgiicola]
MDLATILGAVIGTITVMVVMILSGSLLMYWDFMSLLIVLGGAAAATMMRWPLNVFLGGVKVGMGALFNNVESSEELIDKIIDLANKARKESILSLEKEVIENPLLAKGVRLAVDGAAPEIIDEILSDDMRVMKKNLADGAAIYDDMGESCPAFGMIGTVIGLIVIMANLADPSKIGPGLAVALVTTLYGAMMANMFFIPIAKKLKYRSREHLTNCLIIKTGVLGILNGINPKLIQQRLETYLGKESSGEE